MATATPNTTGNKGTPDLTQKIREQLPSAMPPGQQSFLDVAEAWGKAAWIDPAVNLFKAQIDSALQWPDMVITDKHDSPMPLPDM